MEPTADFWEMLLRLLLAIGCGGLVGWERERRGRAAGLRTHILVAAGAATFTLLAVEIYEDVARLSAGNRPSGVDPTRIIEGVVGGIGFLGAGAIIQGRESVRGLTTAAGLWVVASMGVTAGAGLYGLAGVVAGLTLLTLTGLRFVEKRWMPGGGEHERAEAEGAAQRGNAPRRHGSGEPRRRAGE